MEIKNWEKLQYAPISLFLTERVEHKYWCFEFHVFLRHVGGHHVLQDKHKFHKMVLYIHTYPAGISTHFKSIQVSVPIHDDICWYRRYLGRSIV